MADEENLLDTTKASLERIVKFQAKDLPREDELGRALSLKGAVEPAQKIIDLFKKLPLEALDEFPEAHLKPIKDTADQFYQLLGMIQAFSAEAPGNPGTERDQLIDQLKQQYAPIFKILLPYISYAVARTVDFNKLEAQGRAVVQGIEDQTANLLGEIDEAKTQIQTTLDDVRAAAAEQGVSQQAVYFRTEADNHNLQSKDWLKWTLISSATLAAFSFASLFFHHLPGLNPDDTYAAFHIGASKLLIFAVLGYVVLICGRNFLAHKHNSIVNRHRQNALQTFRTLVDATSSPDAHDIVLTHAASSIYAPQETGYTRQQSQDSSISATSVLRALSQSGGHST